MICLNWHTTKLLYLKFKSFAHLFSHSRNLYFSERIMNSAPVELKFLKFFFTDFVWKTWLIQLISLSCYGTNKHKAENKTIIILNYRLTQRKLTFNLTFFCHMVSPQHILLNHLIFINSKYLMVQMMFTQ